MADLLGMATTCVRAIDPNTPGYYISQIWGQISGAPRGTRYPGGVNGHPGVDYAVGYGTPVRSIGKGVVRWARYANGFGPYCVSIWYPDLGVTSTYGHMMRMDVVEGQWVEAGQVIGGVNSMGQSTGNHLHQEIRPVDAPFGNNPLNIDPEEFYRLHLTGVAASLPGLTDKDRASIKRMQYLLGVSPQSGRWLDLTDAAYQKLRWTCLVDAQGRSISDMATHQKVRINPKSSTVKAVQHDILRFGAADQDGIYGPKTDAAWQLCRLLWLNK